MSGALASLKAAWGRFWETFPVPPQAATLAAASSLAMGFVIGYSVGPNLPFLNAAGPPVVQLPAEEEPSTPDSTPTGSPGDNSSGGSGSSGPTDPASTPTSTPTAPPAVVPPSDPDPPARPPGDDDEDPDPVGFTGPVVHVDPTAESYVIADAGELVAIHADEPPELGREVEVEADLLLNGTYAETDPATPGDIAESTTVSGVVSDRDQQASNYTLSDTGASIVVTLPAGAGGELPQTGSKVTVEVMLDVKEPVARGRDARRKREGDRHDNLSRRRKDERGDGCRSEEYYPDPPAENEIALIQTSVTVDFESLSSASGAAIVQAVCTEEGEMLISADDLRETGRDLRLTLPDNFDTEGIEPGEPIVLRMDPESAEDGSHELFGLGSNAGKKGADDEDELRGDYP